ncbi:hypothetical protein K438DRAFT_1792022 [Mycena galopus ATCC 62051]|nr:hypothetical protein K438DRAFT_1792022 [Mycena galopus ATCC 62051]
MAAQAQARVSKAEVLTSVGVGEQKRSRRTRQCKNKNDRTAKVTGQEPFLDVKCIKPSVLVALTVFASATHYICRFPDLPDHLVFQAIEVHNPLAFLQISVAPPLECEKGVNLGLGWEASTGPVDPLTNFHRRAGPLRTRSMDHAGTAVARKRRTRLRLSPSHRRSGVDARVKSRGTRMRPPSDRLSGVDARVKDAVKVEGGGLAMLVRSSLVTIDAGRYTLGGRCADEVKLKVQASGRSDFGAWKVFETLAKQYSLGRVTTRVKVAKVDNVVEGPASHGFRRSKESALVADFLSATHAERYPLEEGHAQVKVAKIGTTTDAQLAKDCEWITSFEKRFRRPAPSDIHSGWVDARVKRVTKPVIEPDVDVSTPGLRL